MRRTFRVEGADGRIIAMPLLSLAEESALRALFKGLTEARHNHLVGELSDLFNRKDVSLTEQEAREALQQWVNAHSRH